MFSECVEYGEYVYKEDYGAALLTRRTMTKTSQCHIEAVPLVVGGDQASEMEFPHMVRLF